MVSGAYGADFKLKRLPLNLNRSCIVMTRVGENAVAAKLIVPTPIRTRSLAHLSRTAEFVIDGAIRDSGAALIERPTASRVAMQ
jgi:hypothetical protein